MSFTKCKILFIEPFYGGSHKTLIDALTSYYHLVTLPAKKWHWRARCGALMLFEQIPAITNEKILFCSSVLNLCELLGLRPDLQKLRKIVYFHENQLIYPVREVKRRDIQYAYNQITSCLAADIILFNSDFNKSSFLENITKIIKILPDFRPKSIKATIESKCKTVYFPMCYPEIQDLRSDSVLHIVWPHRWEFDKGPDDFFNILFKLGETQDFRLSVLGESFTDNPAIFEEAKEKLRNKILHFGYLESKEDYYKVLNMAHVVVSTAKHEFFGVSMLEATYCGCLPLAPEALVYPEIYPSQCLYSDLDELYKILKRFCEDPKDSINVRRNLNIDFQKYSSNSVMRNFAEFFAINES